MSIRTFLRAHRHLRRFSIGLGVAAVVYTVLGFLVIPAVARSVGQRKLSELLHRPVTIEQIRLNPYALSATVRGLRIGDRDGGADLFALKELYVNLQLASVWKGGAVVQQVRVVEPVIHVVRTAEDRYSFSDIVDALAAAPTAPSPPPAPDAKPARFSVSNIQLVDGQVTLDDRWKATRHQISGINLGIPFLSNFPYLVETFVQPAFAAVINGTRLAVDGRTKPFADSLESSIELNLDKVDLPYYWAYLPVKLRLKLLSAVLDTKLRVTFIQYRDRPPRVDVAGGIALSALKVEDDGGRPLLELPLLDIDIASSDLLSNRLSVRRVLLRSLVAHVRRDRQGELQLGSLVVPDGAAKPAKQDVPAKQPAKQPAKADSKSPPWLIELGELKVDGARIAFADASNARPFATTLAPLNISVEGFSTARDKTAKLTLATTTDAGERLNVEGKLGIEPFTFDGTVALQRLKLPRFAPYYASQILFDVREGTLDLSVPAHVAMKGKELELVITGLRTELRDLQLRRPRDREDFFRLPVLTVAATNFDLGRRDLVLGEVTTSDARIRVEHPAQNQPWSLETLFPAPAATPRSAGPRTPPAAAEAAGREDGFTLTVGKLDLKGWSARIEDRGPRNPATTVVDRLALRVEGLSTAKGKQGRLNLQARLNGSGNLNVSGTLGLTPLQANAQVQLKTIPVVPVQPYFQDSVGLLLTSGHVGLDGRVILASAAKGPVVSYKGEVSAGDFVAVTRDGTEELAKLGKLRISGIDLTSEPFKANIDEIALGDYGAHVVITPEQKLNLAAIVPASDKSAAKVERSPGAAPAQPATTATPAAAQTASPAVRVGSLVLTNGTINLEDRSTHPAFATSLSQFGGRIAGLSFDEGERATVSLAGKLGNGPLEISGRINPLAKQPFIDIVFKLADVDLSAMTPYAGKYAGYAVEKGQLYLDLKYLIDARKLDAQNSVKLSQFTFGQAVDSKDATKLPVRLAVSLLKDRHGVIDLDVPVSGSLDDPKFSIWGVVLTVVKNLLVKAATSPFALIGSLFGGGEELAFVEFEPGLADIPAIGRSKLETLAKALYDRPGLRLEIEGHAAPAHDLEALRRLELRRKVSAEKLKEIVSAGGDAKTDATVTDAEYPKYLKLAYRADEKAAKPKNALGMLKDVPPAEMERLLLSTITVSQDDLRLLARRRAQVAREQILRAKPIPTERIFLIEPKAIAPEHREKVRDSRVDFRLQ
jgi:hypothetical protein